MPIKVNGASKAFASRSLKRNYFKVEAAAPPPQVDKKLQTFYTAKIILKTEFDLKLADKQPLPKWSPKIMCVLTTSYWIYGKFKLEALAKSYETHAGCIASST